MFEIGNILITYHIGKYSGLKKDAIDIYLC